MVTDGAALPPDSGWPRLKKLALEHESYRRRVLRSHKEAGFDSREKDRDEVLQLRRDLDKELGKIAQLELLAQCESQPAPADIPEFRKLIAESPAFVQYLNAYLFFGVRFAACRLENLYANAPNQENPQTDEIQSEFNERPVGLPLPPAPECLRKSSDEMRKDAKRFLELVDQDDKNEEKKEALDFLDGFVESPQDPVIFELWLRGLYYGSGTEAKRIEQVERFKRIVAGLYAWASSRCKLYYELEAEAGHQPRVQQWIKEGWVEGEWQITNPLASRFGVHDFYWLAMILRADVSPRGIVHYQGRSWLSYLQSIKIDNVNYDQSENLRMNHDKNEILRMEEVLRSVFGFACDLIQNAVEMAEYCEEKKVDPVNHPNRPWTFDWRACFDRELTDLANQRRERVFLDRLQLEPEKPRCVSEGGGATDQYWSTRIQTGKCVPHLVGLAFSGGGIRSATFNLGVLEALKEGDRLRHVDYLSTVSGGGYIGSWLIGNVRRTHYWLSRLTSWEESIAHLRRYSKYLAPHSGFLSADSWVIWITWIRNAFLIQLTTVAWLACAFVLAMVVKPLFELAGGKSPFYWPPFMAVAYGLLGVVFIALAAMLAGNLCESNTDPNQHRMAVWLVWIGSFLTAGLLWNVANSWRQAPGPDGAIAYSHALLGVPWTKTALWGWCPPVALALHLILPVGLFACLIVLAKVSFLPKEKMWVQSLGAALLSTLVVHLALSGILYLFGIWAQNADYHVWYAYVFGPPLVLLAIALAIVVFIGLIAGASPDWKREWWTRYGAWIAIWGAGFMVLSLATVFGPVWVHKLFRLKYTSISWGAGISWVGSTIAGLLAGHSGKTKGKGQGSSKILEWVASIGAVVFIAGAILAVSTLLRLAMTNILLGGPSTGWDDLNKLVNTKLPACVVTLGVLAVCAVIFSSRFNLNIFGMNWFYRNRLVRCYLGATRWKPGLRRPQGFTGFDEEDDIPLAELQYAAAAQSQECFRGPFPIVNCSLNLGGSADLDVKTRQSASFSLTPLFAGSARTNVGFAPIKSEGGFARCPTLGQASSISGAAASPNMGYNTSPLVAILLTMFNVRLGWWFPSPGRKKWHRESPIFSLSYLIWEFLGLADETSNFVNVSDGGHFENLGIYELVRRRASVIIACDAECDPGLAFASLGNVIRICETDFGAKIDIDVASMRKQEKTGLSLAHCAVGKISYSNGSIGYLIYLKASITGDEDAGVQQYLASHPDFPHQTTADQFFTEDQFESYRQLGHHIAAYTFRDVADETNMVALASKLYDIWAPSGCSSAAFVSHAKALDQLWERLRTSSALRPLLQELVADTSMSGPLVSPNPEELCACLELLQLMENVFLDLRLDDFWKHPDNRGWALLFTMWAKSSKFRAAWGQMKHTFGIRFEYFCGQRLGMQIGRPVMRV